MITVHHYSSNLVMLSLRKDFSIPSSHDYYIFIISWADPLSNDLNVSFYLQVKIHEAKGLPKDLSHFVFCQYSFWGYEDSVSVPPEISPDTLVEKRNTKTVKFTHERVGCTLHFRNTEFLC